MRDRKESQASLGGGKMRVVLLWPTCLSTADSQHFKCGYFLFSGLAACDDHLILVNAHGLALG